MSSSPARSPAGSRRRSRRVLVGVLLGALLITAAAVVVGVVVLDDDDEAPSAGAPTPEVVVSTPLASYDTSVVTLARADFCAAVPLAAVEEAVGGEVSGASSYGNGQRADLTGQVRDVSHEFSCTWRGPAGASVRAWVFAPPVTADRAASLAAAAETVPGCAKADAPAYGSVSTALLCTSPDQVVASFRGLFGDAWLSCALTTPDPAADPAALLDRTGRWCVTVAQAASSSADQAVPE